MDNIKVVDKGVIDYREAWDFQTELFNSIIKKEEESDYLILCEHPHVYTLGRNGEANNLLINEAFLERIGAKFYKIDRGGDITYHGYGQLVGYPILNLNHFDLSIKRYVELLEQSVINTIAHFGVKGERISGATGVWVCNGGKEEKISAIGVRASRYVTMHGFSLNVNTNLEYFNYINPCGFTTKGVTSLEALCGDKVEMMDVKRIYIEEFGKCF